MVSRLETKELIERVGELHIAGNIIPGSWYHYILGNGTKKNRKPDLVAITMLADIIYWYRPGKKGNKKFHGDMLQTQISYYEEKFHFGESQIKAGLAKLRELNLIRSKAQVIFNDQKGKCQTLLFVEPIVEEIEKITYEEISAPRKETKTLLEEEKTAPRDISEWEEITHKDASEEEIYPPPEEISVPLKEISAPSLEEEISAPNIKEKNTIKTSYIDENKTPSFLEKEPEKELSIQEQAKLTPDQLAEYHHRRSLQAKQLIKLDDSLHTFLGVWTRVLAPKLRQSKFDRPEIKVNENDMPAILEGINKLDQVIDVYHYRQEIESYLSEINIKDADLLQFIAMLLDSPDKWIKPELEQIEI